MKAPVIYDRIMKNGESRAQTGYLFPYHIAAFPRPAYETDTVRDNRMECEKSRECGSRIKQGGFTMKEMQQDSSTIAWNAMGDEWFELAQTGEARNCFIMPNMLKFMGDVNGKRILDLGCGEGGYSRELVRRGAQLVSVDCSRKAIEYAAKLAEEEKLTIEHYVRNSNDLFDIDAEQFDIVLCSMMLMDCEDFDGTLSEAVRVLKPGGCLFASVLHPCFDGNHETGIGRQGTGIDREVVVKNYFEPKEWEAPLWEGNIPVIWRHRTMEDYVKAFIRAGLTIADLNEPRATDEQSERSVVLAWLRKIPLYLYWKLIK